MDFDLFLLNKLSQIKDKRSGPSSAGVMPAMLPNDDSVEANKEEKPLATIWNTTCRSSTPTQTWNNSLNGENFYAYDNGTSSRFQKFFMPAVSSAESSTATYNMRTDSLSHDVTQGIQFAGAGTCGVQQFNPSQNYNTSYSPVMTRIMFIKNTTDAAISYTPYFWCSSQWSSGYDGASLTYYVPNSDTYSGVTGVNTSSGWSYQSSSWIVQTNGSALSIPANTTVALVLTNSCNSWTSTYSIHWVYQHSGFYNLQAMPQGLECDLKATLAYATMRDDDYLEVNANRFTESDIVKFYNNVGLLYGENQEVV